jgi:hypothetical protein
METNLDCSAASLVTAIIKNEIDKEDQIGITGKRKVKKKTLAGWALEVEWRDGGTSWIELKTMKESNAVEAVEYAFANQISNEPDFEWWVRDILRRKKRLIKLSQSRFLRPQYKYGICVPRKVEEALKFDLENGNTFWELAIEKKIKNVRVAFKFLEPPEKPAPGYKKIPLRIIFDIKMDFTRKAQFVAGGAPNESTTMFELKFCLKCSDCLSHCCCEWIRHNHIGCSKCLCASIITGKIFFNCG